jgi:hypothetical protein
MSTLRVNSGNLHYTVNYLQFVADHRQDDKALATFLGVPG